MRVSCNIFYSLLFVATVATIIQARHGRLGSPSQERNVQQRDHAEVKNKELEEAHSNDAFTGFGGLQQDDPHLLEHHHDSHYLRKERFEEENPELEDALTAVTLGEVRGLQEDDRKLLSGNLEVVGNNGEPAHVFPLGRCQGDCDSDSECQSGLKCFQRDALEPVPGCDGDGAHGNDYCYQPGDPTPPSGNLENVGNNGEPTHVFPLGRCQGDCDSDSECQSGLVCFQRDAFEPVPGCNGDGAHGNDYCYQPGDYPTPPPPPPPPSGNLDVVGNNGEPANVFPLGECQGDCDSDSECWSSLKCFQRDELEPVPGCNGAGAHGKDYCYRPRQQGEYGLFESVEGGGCLQLLNGDTSNGNFIVLGDCNPDDATSLWKYEPDGGRRRPFIQSNIGDDKCLQFGQDANALPDNEWMRIWDCNGYNPLQHFYIDAEDRIFLFDISSEVCVRRPKEGDDRVSMRECEPDEGSGHNHWIYLK